MVGSSHWAKVQSDSTTCTRQLRWGRGAVGLSSGDSGRQQGWGWGQQRGRGERRGQLEPLGTPPPQRASSGAARSNAQGSTLPCRCPSPGPGGATGWPSPTLLQLWRRVLPLAALWGGRERCQPRNVQAHGTLSGALRSPLWLRRRTLSPTAAPREHASSARSRVCRMGRIMFGGAKVALFAPCPAATGIGWC